MDKFKAATMVLFCEKCEFTCKTKKSIERHSMKHNEKMNNKMTIRKLGIDDLDLKLKQQSNVNIEDYTISDPYGLEKIIYASMDEEQEDFCDKNVQPLNEEFTMIHNLDTPELFNNEILNNSFSFQQNNFQNISSGNFFISDSIKYRNYEDFILQTGHYILCT